MSQLIYIKQKIRSIQTTKKITHAVRLVSMSFYNKLDKFESPLKYYTKNVKNLFLSLLPYAPDWKNETLFSSDLFDASPLIIIVSTSKGLCGSLNSNLFHYVEKALFIEKHQKPHFIAVGQKAVTFIREKGFSELIATYPELGSNNFIALAEDLVNKILTNKTAYSSVTFYANEPRSFFIQRPYKFTLTPVSLEPITSDKTEVEEQFIGIDSPIWEQSTDDIFNYLTVCYLKSTIMYLLFQSLRAEHAARFLAMENSTNNAEKYLEALNMQFNKLRQALITKEVAELSSSFPSR